MDYGDFFRMLMFSYRRQSPVAIHVMMICGHDMSSGMDLYGCILSGLWYLIVCTIPTIPNIYSTDATIKFQIFPMQFCRSEILKRGRTRREPARVESALSSPCSCAHKNGIRTCKETGLATRENGESRNQTSKRNSKKRNEISQIDTGR